MGMAPLRATWSFGAVTFVNARYMTNCLLRKQANSCNGITRTAYHCSENGKSGFLNIDLNELRELSLPEWDDAVTVAPHG